VWSCHIERAENGYIVSYPSDDDENRIIPHVIEEADNDDLMASEALLWWLMDYFNFGGSKYDPVRLKVVREHQNG
jgi:hypothetical protein